MTDPYKVLGVSPNASDDEIKKAYHALARKYHPDKYRDSDLADLASEKMKEVNAAYEEIQSIRKNGGNSQNYNNSSSSQGGYNYGSGTSKNPLYNEIRSCINQGNLDEAESKLLAIHEADRVAEWNFLYGYLLIKRGQFVDAQRYIDLACGMDPYNPEYRKARQQLHRQANGYGEEYDTPRVGCCCCDLCAGLMCLDCLCNCLTCH